ncbi:MAG: hypothetical protein WD206_04165 [Actinomycetota bacterium]
MTRLGRGAALVVGLAMLALVVPIQVASASVSPWPSDATTTVDLTTGSRGRTYTGIVQIQFRNSGPDPLTSVYVRLWPNGLLGCNGRPPDIRVSAPTGGSFGNYLLRCSARELVLDDPVAPGATATIGMQIEIALPQRNDRFGWTDTIAFAGTAIPILAAEDADGVHLDPYTDAGESMYAPVGDVLFTVTSPKGLRFASAGTAQATTKLVNGRIRRTYFAEEVRDFAWAAGRFDRAVGTASDGTRVRVWHVGGASTARTMRDQTIRSLDLMSAIFGDYHDAWNELDVVKSAYTTFGGMEYPSIVFSNPNAGVLAHEVGHQWWWGIVGNDSYRSPFLDEGLAEWSALYVVARPFAKSSSWCTPLPWPRESARLTNGMGYWDQHGGYGLVYEFGSCAISDLVDRLGMARVKSMLHDYAANHWLSPMTTVPDFMDAVIAASEDVPSFDPDAWFAEWRIGPV